MPATPALSLSTDIARRHRTALVLRPRYTPVPTARAAVPVLDEARLLLARADRSREKDASRLPAELARTGRKTLPASWPRQTDSPLRTAPQVPTLRELGH